MHRLVVYDKCSNVGNATSSSALISVRYMTLTSLPLNVVVKQEVYACMWDRICSSEVGIAPS